MAFSPKDWKDYPDTSTPITAAALEDLETRVVEAGLQLYTGTGKKIKWGTHTSDSFGGQNRNNESITHGLGTTPTIVFACASTVPAANASTSVDEPVVCSIKAFDGTSIDVTLALTNGATCGVAVSVYWLAIY